ncbi:MAG: energy-coupling factor transporter ATPase [Halanaerobiales bacterium]
MLIKLENVTHVYQQQGITALDDISLGISTGEFIGVIGQTGSGKSTLVQVFNGLIKPTSGLVIVDGKDITRNKVNLKKIRQKVGLVFQYPEHQLFEESVAEDIAFGPKNLKLDKNEVENRVKESMSLVGMDYDLYGERSPFNLSGGQQRRVAIAGVLAMKPEVLILDEPTAGLDPTGREKLMNLLQYLHDNLGMTIVLISHRMGEIARLANRVLVLDKGKLIMDNTPRKVFNQGEKLKKLGLDLPQVSLILKKLQARGLNVRSDIFTIKEAKNEILSALRRSKSC